jgi:hypothetical protein
LPTTPRWLCGGQHSAAALRELHDTKGGDDNGMWQKPLAVGFIVYDPNSTEDLEFLALAVKALNAGHKVTLHDSYLDDLMKARVHMMNLVEREDIDFVDGDSLPSDIRDEVRKRLNNNKTKFGDIWRVLQMPTALYDKILPYFKGDCHKGAKMIKAPTSGSHFAVIGGIDYATVNSFVNNLTTGEWTGQIFLNMCKLWKKSVRTRLSVVRHAQSVNNLPDDVAAELREMWNIDEDGKKKKGEDLSFFDIGNVWEMLVRHFPRLGKEELIKPFAMAMSSHNINTPFEIPPLLRDLVDKIFANDQVCCVLLLFQCFCALIDLFVFPGHAHQSQRGRR